MVRPARHLAARRRDQDPRRGRRRADVHRGPAAARAGAGRASTADRREPQLVPAAIDAAARHRRGRSPPGSRRCRTPSWPRCCAPAPVARAGDRRGPVPGVRRPDRARSTAAGTSSSPAPRARPATRRPARSTSGTFRTAAKRLDAVAAMGFDVIYLPPIHPIGEVNRKGPNNTLDPRPRRHRLAVGDRQQATAATTRSTPTSARSTTSTPSWRGPRELGLEVALDLALQAAPDHPWVDEPPGVVHHPRRRHHRLRREPAEEVPGHLPDQLRQRPRAASPPRCCGSSGTGWPTACGSSASTTRTPSRWRSGSGCSREVRATDPDVLFLSEAFTRPAMMHALGAVGFHQSYTYFTWRTAKRRDRGLPARAVARDRPPDAAELLRQHPRHPPRVPAVRRPGGVQDPRRARRDAARPAGACTPATSCSSTSPSSRAARSTSTRRSTRSGSATGTPPRPRAARWRRTSPGSTRSAARTRPCSCCAT